MNDFSKHEDEPAKKAKKKKEITEDDIDISNVTGALGLNGCDDLDGDIF